MTKETEQKVRKVLFNEVTFLIAVIGVVSSFIFWIVNPQNDLQLQLVRLESQLESNQTIVSELEKIKNNDFVEIHEAVSEIEERQIKILESLARINQALSMK